MRFRTLSLSLSTLGVPALALAGWAAMSANTAAPRPDLASAGTYSVDPVHSGVFFQIKHAGVTNFYGRFNTFSGSFSFDPAAPEDGSFSFTVDAASVDTGAEGRDNHLRTPDFFNVRQFPEISFQSTSVTPSQEEGAYRIEGDLTLHGVTKPVTADMMWLGTGEFRNAPIGAFEATFRIKRSDFDMTKYMAEDLSDSGGLGNNVTLYVSVEARKE
ncbi:MAG: YceI family protein [Phycisphaeraceae bacterium]|nr:YceI family protein [Phycisphaeraceae bacterium]